MDDELEGTLLDIEEASLYKTDSTVVSGDLAIKVCEVLGLDPNEVNSITIEAATFMSGCLLTVKSVDREKLKQ